MLFQFFHKIVHYYDFCLYFPPLLQKFSTAILIYLFEFFFLWNNPGDLMWIVVKLWKLYLLTLFIFWTFPQIYRVLLNYLNYLI